MDSGYYALCTSLMARSQALDLVANNLANTSTSGYRAQHNIFGGLLATASGLPLSPINQAVNNYGILRGSQLDLSQGNLERTGNDLDLAIEGPGFFVVKTPSGNLYTRDGNFHVSPQKQLVTSEGDVVLGDSGPIQVLDGPVSVSADGTISINGALAGKLKTVEFPAGTPMQSVGKTYYSAPAHSDVAATQSSIAQGTLETSNVNPVSSVVELISVQRYAELTQRALSLVNSGMNQTAVQDLPRISNN